MTGYYTSEIFMLLLCGFVALLSWWYIRFTKDFDFWKKQGVPGQKPRFLIGTFKPTWKKGFEDQDIDDMKKFGLVHGEFEGSIPILFVSDPDMLKQIMVKDFSAFSSRRTMESMKDDKLMGNMLSVMHGEKWKMVRNTLSPTFTTGKLKQMVYLIEECANILTDSLKEKSQNCEPIDFARLFPVLTLDVISSCAFGIKPVCIKNPESEFVIKSQKAFRMNPILVYIVFVFSFIFKRFPSFFQNPFKYYTEIANKTIDMRLQNKDNTRRDFLQIMLEAEVANDDVNESLESEGQQKNKKTLTRDIVVAQTVLFILAGHETTATALSLIAYELAVNQDVQEKLLEEVDEVMTESKKKLNYEAVMGMKYLDMVVSETLRKYPPAVRADRECNENTYALNNIILRKGIRIMIPIYAIHHNPDFYPDPEKFDPERFSAENKANRNPYTYLPFGAGPRNCIAMRFALMELKLVMVHILANYRFNTCQETEIPVTFRKGMGLMQANSVKLVLQKRFS